MPHSASVRDEGKGLGWVMIKFNLNHRDGTIQFHPHQSASTLLNLTISPRANPHRTYDTPILILSPTTTLASMELEGSDDIGVADREWNKISTDFMTAGYREGITTGKESALQEGFDDGFASTGAPLGRRLGTLRGQANALLALCTRRQLADLEAEVREIVQGLARIKLSALAPPDMQVIEHSKEHESEAPDVGDVETSNQMGDLEEAFESLSTSKSAGKEDVMRRSVEATAELNRLGERLETVGAQLLG
ncbi:unnamed protein product [Rhizoctonia solani]|uniref:Protein YAE1 n=1 Tax=Rhizoctonia solani TaxID=456999 RepID=A0A8H3AZ18_9AGAM|nr:unnamed protein product [Rhizoctonia solani]